MVNRKPNTVCSRCHKDIYRRPSQIQSGPVFCSLLCHGHEQRKSRQCSICEKEFYGRKNNCSRSCANKARTGISYTKENAFNKAYKGKVLKELVAKRCDGKCERCKENNYAILQVHHKKERHKGGGDTLSNLELLCPNCHASHHMGRSLYKIQKMI